MVTTTEAVTQVETVEHCIRYSLLHSSDSMRQGINSWTKSGS